MQRNDGKLHTDFIGKGQPNHQCINLQQKKNRDNYDYIRQHDFKYGKKLSRDKELLYIMIKQLSQQENITIISTNVPSIRHLTIFRK